MTSTTTGWQRVSRGETKIDFVGQRRRWFTISAVLIGLSLLGLAVRGLNLGLEFTGGVSVQADNPAGADVGDFRSAITTAGVPEARIQLVNAGQGVRIQTPALDGDAEAAMIDAVVSVSGTPRDSLSLEAVGPTFGAIVARRALEALLVFLGIVAIFISWRLEWKMAAAGLTALGHDLIITVGVYAITGFAVTPATVVAVLTILGYSLYDTVVVFDKVEEFERELSDDNTITEIVNRAMNQVLVRSINTSLTSLIPVGSLLFVGAFILGAASLRDFALALFVGIAAGTYSSIFVAAPLLASWKENEEQWVLQRQRLNKRAEKAASRVRQQQLASQRLSDEAAAPVRNAPPGSPPRGPKGAPPRPPKKRKKRR